MYFAVVIRKYSIMIRKFVALLMFFVFVGAVGATDFNKIDKYARSVKKANNYKQLAHVLVKPFSSEKDKVRSIFIWITHNIKYDYRKFKSNQRSGGYRIKGRSKREIALKKKKIKDKKIAKVYRLGKGVCEDYSYLFEAMCKEVGIKVKYITGYIRNNSRAIGKFPKHSAHAWNAVNIDGKWYLLDATWAAGSVDHKTGRFKRDYHEGFFLTEPNLFILNHFPSDKRMQFLKNPICKKVFASQVYPHGEFYKTSSIIDILPKSAYLSAKKKYSLVKIKFNGEIPELAMFKKGKIVKLKQTRVGGEVTLKIPTLAKYRRSVIIGINKGRRFQPILEYKIR